MIYNDFNTIKQFHILEEIIEDAKLRYYGKIITKDEIEYNISILLILMVNKYVYGNTVIEHNEELDEIQIQNIKKEIKPIIMEHHKTNTPTPKTSKIEEIETPKSKEKKVFNF